MTGSIIQDYGSPLVGYYLVGLIFAYLDTKWGIPTVNWFRKLSRSPDKEFERLKRGFIYGRKNETKIKVAAFISATHSIILTFYLMFTGNPFNIMNEFVLAFFEAGVMLLGFYSIGLVKDWINGFFNVVAPKLDEMERGETTVGNIIGDVASSATEKTASAVGSAVKGATGKVGSTIGDGVEKARAGIDSIMPASDHDSANEEAPKEPYDAESDLQRIKRDIERGF